MAAAAAATHKNSVLVRSAASEPHVARCDGALVAKGDLEDAVHGFLARVGELAVHSHKGCRDLDFNRKLVCMGGAVSGVQ